MSIHGQERIGAEWWRLYCGPVCCRQHIPDLIDVETFANLDVLHSRLGWEPEEAGKHRLVCGCCGIPLGLPGRGEAEWSQYAWFSELQAALTGT